MDAAIATARSELKRAHTQKIGQSLAGVTVFLIVASVAIASRVPDGLAQLLEGFSLSSLVVAIAFLVLGALLLGKHPNHLLAWVCIGIALSQALSLTGVYGFAGLERGWPGAEWSVWLSQWAWVPGYLAIPTLLLLFFPNGYLPGRRWWFPLLISLASILLSSIGWATLPYEAQDSPLDVAVLNPVASGLGEPLMSAGGALGILAALLSIVSLGARFRGSSGRSRQQLKWVFVAAGATAMLLGLAVAVGPALGAAVRLVATIPLPAAIGVAILKHRLWDVDVVINKAFVYGVLSLFVVGIYVLAVTLLGGIIGERVGAPLLAAALVAVAIEPLRRRLQRLANRLLYGAREDPYQAMADLSQRLDALDPESSVVSDVPRTLARTLRIPYVAIEVHGHLRAKFGRQTAHSSAFLLSHRGQHLGRLVIGSHEERNLSARETRLIKDLSRQVSAALRAEELMRDLAAAREQLVVTREEERRSLRRDLHDDLGPSLAAAALQIENARSTLHENGGSATEILDRITDEIREAVRSVRSIVEDLGPPALDDLGLIEAVRQLIGRVSATSGLPITFELRGDLRSLPAATEMAAYRIVSEALTNVAKHSGASSSSVRMIGEDSLIVEVEDDGRGIRSVGLVDSGVGLRSMEERAVELGGRLEVAGSEDGGTKVTAWLPLRRS